MKRSKGACAGLFIGVPLIFWGGYIIWGVEALWIMGYFFGTHCLASVIGMWIDS